MSELPPLPELPGNECIPLSLIRYVPGYTKSFVQEYATAYARACLASAPTIQPTQPVQEPETEVRADGQTVRVDRWQVGIRRIVALLWGNRAKFEVDEVVEAVRALIPEPKEDDEGLVRGVFAQAGDAGEPSDGERYRLLRRGQHWSVIDGIGNVLRGDDLDAAADAILADAAIRATKGGKL